MARSYRKPYASWCGHNHSSAHDKRMASRAVRRKQETALKQAVKEDTLEDFLMADIYECAHNDVWTWIRDGKQHLCYPQSRRYAHEFGVALQLGRDDLLREAAVDLFDSYNWWLDLQRK